MTVVVVEVVDSIMGSDAVELMMLEVLVELGCIFIMTKLAMQPITRMKIISNNSRRHDHRWARLATIGWIGDSSAIGDEHSNLCVEFFVFKGLHNCSEEKLAPGSITKGFA